MQYAQIGQAECNTLFKDSIFRSRQECILSKYPSQNKIKEIMLSLL